MESLIDPFAAGLANFIMEKPLRAQRIFHQVLYVASVAITLQLRATREVQEDHCAPSPPILPPHDPAFPASFYPDLELKKRFDGEVTIDKEDLDLTLQSLASHLPLDSSTASEDPYAVPTSAQVSLAYLDGVPRGHHSVFFD